MTPIDAAALVCLMVIPFHWLVQRQLAKEENRDPRRCGIVIVRERALDGYSGSVGCYKGRQIWETVTFRGLVYRFDRVIPPSQCERLAPGELYLDPGLVYVTGRE
jgi:hypothetical protein